MTLCASAGRLQLSFTAKRLSKPAQDHGERASYWRVFLPDGASLESKAGDIFSLTEKNLPEFLPEQSGFSLSRPRAEREL